ncbi:MAG: hypothetical protein ACREAW_02115, partial [Nitrososphaera sp.]
HFSILDKDGSNINGVYAALVMKEKESGKIVKQVPYRFYEFGDISMPYRFHDNEDYVATLLAGVNGETPFQTDFDITVGRATMSLGELALMVVPFASGLAAGFVFLFRKKHGSAA